MGGEISDATGGDYWSATDSLLVFGQRMVPVLSSAIHPVGDAGMAAVPPVILGPVGLVTIELALTTMQQLVESADVGLRSGAGVTDRHIGAVS